MNQPCSSLPTPLQYLKQLLGTRVEESAAQMGAFQRSRKIENVWQLLWLLLVFCTHNYSVAQVTDCFASKFESISETAIAKRIQKSSKWLEFLVQAVLKQRAHSWAQTGRRIILVDSTCIHALRDTSSVTQATFMVDLMSLCSTSINVHLGQAAERLECASDGTTSTFVGDAGYCRQKIIQKILQNDHHFVIRYKPKSIKLYTKEGAEFCLDYILDKTATPGTFYAAELQLPFVEYKGVREVYKADRSRGNWPVHLYALRLSEEKADRRAEALKKQKKSKGKPLSEYSKFMSRWMIILTSHPSNEISAQCLMELYGFRWQIELVFRRLKQTMDLMKSRAQSQGKLHQSFLYASFLMHLLMEEHVSLVIDPHRQVILNGRRCVDRQWKLCRDEWAAELLTFYTKHAAQALPARQSKKRALHRSQTVSSELIQWIFQKPPIPPLNVGLVA